MDPGVSVQKQNFQAYPCKNKTSQETQRILQKFLEPERKPKVIYTDNSLEFGKACEDLSWNHCTSTPHRSETNGIAERAVRRVKEGTSAVLLQSGLNESWWADSMECYTYLRNVTDLLSDGKTPYERRFGQPFKGPIIPFGSLVEYYPFTAKDQSRIHQFGKKVLPGLFLGYALYAGGIWKGDVLIADLEELETMDASEIYSKRLNAKEVIFPKQGEFIYPIVDGRIKTLGGDQELRTSTLIRPRPIQGESNIDFLGESEMSLPQPHDSLPDAGEAINDFWSMSGSFKNRHHVEPRVKLYSPREESFPIPLKHIDVTRTTHTNLDVKQEKRIRHVTDGAFSMSSGFGLLRGGSPSKTLVVVSKISLTLGVATIETKHGQMLLVASWNTMRQTWQDCAVPSTKVKDLPCGLCSCTAQSPRSSSTPNPSTLCPHTQQGAKRQGGQGARGKGPGPQANLIFSAPKKCFFYGSPFAVGRTSAPGEKCVARFRMM